MKEIFDDYGGMVVGAVAAAGFFVLVWSALGADGILHNAVLSYVNSIC